MSRSEIQARNKARGLVCEIDGCETGVLKAGLCGYHHSKAKQLRRAARGVVCSVAGCERGRFARGLCSGHYNTEYSRESRARQSARTRRPGGTA